MESILYAFANKFLSGKDLERVKEELRVTEIGKSLIEEGKEEAKEQFFFKLAANPEDKLNVRGDMGNWQQAIPLKFLGKNLWMLELACEPNKTMQFKILKGDAWEQGPNRELTTGKNPSIVELKALQF